MAPKPPFPRSVGAPRRSRGAPSVVRCHNGFACCAGGTVATV